MNREQALAEALRLLIDELDVNLSFIEGLLCAIDETEDRGTAGVRIVIGVDQQRDLIASCRALLARNIA